MKDVESLTEDLLKLNPADRFGMKESAPWDSYFLIDPKHVTFELMISWHFGCFFDEEKPQNDQSENR